MNQDNEKAPAGQGEGNDTRKVNQMSDNIVPTGNESTFDQIKQTRKDGSEFWSARDLAAVMAYDQWRNFASAIDRARMSLENQRYQADDHIAGASKLVELGSGASRLVDDFHMTRFGAYLTVMNGDPRKKEVAAAQAYFAVKTREAETAAPNVVALPSRAALAQMVLDAEKELDAAKMQAELDAPKVRYHEKFVAEMDDVMTIEFFASQWGTTEPKVRKALLEKGVAVRRRIGQRWSKSKGRMEDVFEWRPRQGTRFAEWFVVRPQHNAPRHHNGQVRQTMYLLSFHSEDLAQKVGLNEPVMFNGGDAA